MRVLELKYALDREHMRVMEQVNRKNKTSRLPTK